MMRIAICVLVWSLGTAHAQAPAKAKATAAYAEAQRRYAAGDYVVAAAKFLEAYASEPDPAYLFNVAQSFRFAHDCVQAATYYRRFLAAVTSAPNLDKVRAYFDEMELCANARRPAQLTPRPPPPQPRPRPPPPQPRPPPEPRPPTSHADPGATKRHVGMALGGGGLVAIAIGVWFHRDVGYFERQVRGCTQAHPCTADQVNHWNDRGDAASTAAIASYSIGGAAVIGGGLLYLLGRIDANEQPVAISPTRGGAMVTAGFAF